MGMEECISVWDIYYDIKTWVVSPVRPYSLGCYRTAGTQPLCVCQVVFSDYDYINASEAE